MFISRKKFNNLKKELSKEIDNLKASKEVLSLEFKMLVEDPFITVVRMYKSVYGYNFAFAFGDKCYSKKAQETLNHIKKLSDKIEGLEDECKKLKKEKEELNKENKELEIKNNEIKNQKYALGILNHFMSGDKGNVFKDEEHIDFIYGGGIYGGNYKVAIIVKDFFTGDNIIKQTSNKVVHLDVDGNLLEGGYTKQDNTKGFNYKLIQNKSLLQSEK